MLLRRALLEIASLKANQAEMMEIMGTTARAVAALAAEKGVPLSLPVPLPVMSIQQLKTFEEWLSQGSNTSNFVSKTTLFYMFNVGLHLYMYTFCMSSYKLSLPIGSSPLKSCKFLKKSKILAENIKIIKILGFFHELVRFQLR